MRKFNVSEPIRHLLAGGLGLLTMINLAALFGLIFLPVPFLVGTIFLWLVLVGMQALIRRPAEPPEIEQKLTDQAQFGDSNTIDHAKAAIAILIVATVLILLVSSLEF